MIMNDGDADAWAAGNLASYYPGVPLHYRAKWYGERTAPRMLFCLGIHGQNLFVDIENEIVIAKFSSQAQPLDAACIRLTGSSSAHFAMRSRAADGSSTSVSARFDEIRVLVLNGPRLTRGALKSSMSTHAALGASARRTLSEYGRQPMIDLSAIREATPAEMPIIDLFRYDEESETDQHRLGDAIVGALRTSGFFVLVRHGVRRDVIRGAFAAAREFHALAPERKRQLAMEQGFVGYLASGDYTVKTSEVNANTKADINAAFFFDRERMADDPEVVAGVPFRYTNKWPHELPIFRERCLRYFYGMEALARSLLPAIATGLGARPDYFDEGFQSPQGTVRMSYYPVACYETNQCRPSLTWR